MGEQVKKYHHTLTQILTGLLHSGFELKAVEEAVPDLDMTDIPGMRDEMRRPMMLLVKAVKKRSKVWEICTKHSLHKLSEINENFVKFKKSLPEHEKSVKIISG